MGEWISCIRMLATCRCGTLQLQRRIAGLYEADAATQDAADAFQHAADYFLGEDMYSQAVQCLCRSGALYADEEMCVRSPRIW